MMFHSSEERNEEKPTKEQPNELLERERAQKVNWEAPLKVAACDDWQAVVHIKGAPGSYTGEEVEKNVHSKGQCDAVVQP